MEPTEKSKEIDNLLFVTSGRDRKQSIRSAICAWCGGDASHFTDDLSRKEYTISGMCQDCQDQTFGSDE